MGAFVDLILNKGIETNKTYLIIDENRVIAKVPSFEIARKYVEEFKEQDEKLNLKKTDYKIIVDECKY